MEKTQAKFTRPWKEAKEPFLNDPIDLEMHGADLRIKRFMIYEDEKIKVTRTEEPTYLSEHNNYVELLVKNGATLVHFPIGGYITREMAIDNARRYVLCMQANKDIYEALECILEKIKTVLSNNDFLFEHSPEDFVPERTSFEEVKELAKTFYFLLTESEHELRAALAKANGETK